MLPGAHALQALTPKDTLNIQRGSCVRHRFARSTCEACFNVCPEDALSWSGEGLQWNSDKCQGCLLCIAICPSGALRASEISFVSLLQELAKVDNPVLACSGQSQTTGHARLPCLGALANPELLLAFSLALGKNLKLNLSTCASCANVAVVAPLKKALQKMTSIPLADNFAIEPVFDPKAIAFEERSCSRREFFSLLRNRSQKVGLCVVDRLKAEQKTNYGAKQIPVSRQLLLQVMKLRKEESPHKQARLFPSRVTSANCRQCTGCVGICPTGALLPPAESERTPAFKAERCISCKLCEDFCSRTGIKIEN